MRQRSLWWCSMVMLLWWHSPSEAILGAADVVFDPSNYASNLIQQYEAVQQTINDGIQIANQVKQLEHQLQGLIYQAQNLQANPLRLLEQIQRLWGEYNSLLQNAEGMSYHISTSVTEFEQRYPSVAGTGLGSTIAQMQQASQSQLQQMRLISKTAVKTQSIYEQLCDLQAQNHAALASAQEAVGALQVGQAQAQLQTLTNQQLAQIAEITATQARIQTAKIMKEVQEEEAARESNTRWMAGFGAAGFRGVKEGQGVNLP